MKFTVNDYRDLIKNTAFDNMRLLKEIIARVGFWCNENGFWGSGGSMGERVLWVCSTKSLDSVLSG